VLEIDDEICINPAVTFPIKKRIKIESFIDGTTALYIIATYPQ